VHVHTERATQTAAHYIDVGEAIFRRTWKMYKEKPNGPILSTVYLHCHYIIQQANTQIATFHFTL